MQDNKDLKFEAFTKLIPHLRGALWWAANDLIKEVQPGFNNKDLHKGHPLLSTRKGEVKNRFDMVPMLVGTSAVNRSEQTRHNSVMVTGMTKKEPEHRTFFGTIVMPGRYPMVEMLEAVTPQKSPKPWYKVHTMHLNEDKPVVNAIEMQSLERFCKIHGLGA